MRRLEYIFTLFFGFVLGVALLFNGLMLYDLIVQGAPALTIGLRVAILLTLLAIGGCSVLLEREK